MAKGDKDAAEALKAEVAALKTTLPALEEDERQLSAQAAAALAACPTCPDAVPEGEDEPATWKSTAGAPAPVRLRAQEHADMGPALGLDLKPAR
jgi:seryl-tRNA synthetase